MKVAEADEKAETYGLQILEVRRIVCTGCAMDKPCAVLSAKDGRTMLFYLCSSCSEKIRARVVEAESDPASVFLMEANSRIRSIATDLFMEKLGLGHLGKKEEP